MRRFFDGEDVGRCARAPTRTSEPRADRDGGGQRDGGGEDEGGKGGAGGGDGAARAGAGRDPDARARPGGDAHARAGRPTPAPAATPAPADRGDDPGEPLLDYLFGGGEMSSRGNIAGNPVLIGAATVLVILVAVFLSYNANQGLPFVPSYKLTAEMPSAANLVRGNEVRIGGTRVGTVDSIGVERRDDGASIALLGLKLERSVDPLPIDSTLLIRPRSALGLKYVEIMRGTSDDGFADGDTIPLANATPDPVEFDEFTNMFDEETRDASQTNLKEFGDALAGRGASHQPGDRRLPPAARGHHPGRAEPRRARRRTSRASSSSWPTRRASSRPPPRARPRSSSTSTPPSAPCARSPGPYIQESIAEGPATLDAAIESLPRAAAVPGQHRGAVPRAAARRRLARDHGAELAGALEVGTPVLRRYPAVQRAPRLAARGGRRRSPRTRWCRAASAASPTRRSTLKPTLTYLAPAQLTCNYLSLWFRNVSSLLSEGDNNGTWQRFIIVATPQGPNNEGGLASAPANGPTLDNHLHSNPYPNTASPGQPKECEAGNERYIAGQTVIGNVPGTQQAATERKAAK